MEECAVCHRPGISWETVSRRPNILIVRVGFSAKICVYLIGENLRFGFREILLVKKRKISVLVRRWRGYDKRRYVGCAVADARRNGVEAQRYG